MLSTFLFFQAQGVKRAKSEQPSLGNKNKSSREVNEAVQSKVDEERTETESVSNSNIKDGVKRVAGIECTEAEGQNNVRNICEFENESKEKKKATKSTKNESAAERRDSKKIKDKDHGEESTDKKEEDASSGNSGDIDMASNEEEKKNKKRKESKSHKGDKEDINKDNKVESAKSGETKKKGTTSMKRTKDEIKVENKGDEKKEALIHDQDDKNEKKTKGGFRDFFCKYNVLFQKYPLPSPCKGFWFELPPPTPLEIPVQLDTFL